MSSTSVARTGGSCSSGSSESMSTTSRVSTPEIQKDLESDVTNKIMTQSLPPNAAPLKLLRTTKVTAPAPVRLRRSAPSNNNGNGNVKPSLNPHRASYPSPALPTVTENRSLDNHYFKTGSQQTLRNSGEFSQPYESGFSTTVASNSNDRLSGTDGKSLILYYLCIKCTILHEMEEDL